MVCPSLSDQFKLRRAHQITHQRRWAERKFFITIHLASSLTALDKKRRQPKQTAVIPIAIFHSNIDVRKEFKRITGSSRGKVKPLLPDNPYYSTNPHKSFNTQSFANNSDWGNLSPPFFGRGLYAPSTRSSKETAKGHSTDLTYNFD